jgi:hypothetical protein
MISNIRKLSVLLALSAVSLFAVTNSARAVITGPYTPDANTVHLWHMDDLTSPAAPAPGGGMPANAVGTGFPLDQGDIPGGDQVAPAILGNPAYTGFGYSGRTGPGILDGHDARAFFKVAGNTTDPATPAKIYGSAAGSFTMEGLFNFASFSGGSAHQYLLGTSDWDDRARVYIRDLNTTSPNLYVGVDGGGSVGGLPVSIPQPALNTWYHIALTYDAGGGAGNVKFYMTEMDDANTEANLVATLTSSTPGVAHGLPAWDFGWGPTPELTDRFHVGAVGGGMLDGYADEVRISNIARTASQFMFAEENNNAVVPEPSTYALGLIGLAGLGLVAWRRRRCG